MPDVIRRVLADDIDNSRARLLRVVQIGKPVAETRTQVQQRAGRLAGHAEEAIRRAGDDALEQPQHAAHPFNLVERGNEVHLRSARIGKTNVDIACDQRAD